MTILSCKSIFGLTFSAILENLLGSFFFQSPKNCDFGQNRQNENFYKKSAGRAIFTPIVPQLHAEFQKNRWSGFRDQFVTNIRKSRQG